MAVYTQVSAGDVRDFLSLYDAGAYAGHEPILQGVENSNYRLTTDRNVFILTLFEKRVKPEDLPFFFAFTTHLAGQGIPVPGPLSQKGGAYFSTLCGRPAALFPFFPGKDKPLDVIRPADCEELGRMIARLHRAAAGFTGTRANDLSLQGWVRLAGLTREKADSVKSGLRALIADEVAFLERNWPAGLPVCAIHADIFPDNVFFNEGHLSAVIDFYFSCTDYRAYDLAVAVNAWCFDSAQAFQGGRFAALMGAYQRVILLDRAETDAFTILCRGAALRFLLTRLYDWINHDPASFVKPHDPLAYAARLVHFREQGKQP